jgi:hypothetical protein
MEDKASDTMHPGYMFYNAPNTTKGIQCTGYNALDTIHRIKYVK